MNNNRFWIWWLQLQLIITAHTLKFYWMPYVWRIPYEESLTNLGLISTTQIHECTAFYNCHAAGIRDHHVRQFHCSFMLSREWLCLATCYLATTCLLLLVTETSLCQYSLLQKHDYWATVQPFRLSAIMSQYITAFSGNGLLPRLWESYVLEVGL
jgi:hypothetical protein